MPIQRLTLANIIAELRRIYGEPTAATSAFTDAQAVLLINGYGQRLATRCAQVAGRPDKTPRFDMWRTNGTLTCSAGSATVYFPLDYDSYIEFYDSTNRRPIYPLEKVNKYAYRTLRHKALGPPEAIEIRDFATVSGDWRRQGTIYPTPPSSITPSIALVYHRLPVAMPNSSPSSEYPDVDPKFQWLFVYGPACELLRSNDPSYNRFQELERELLKELAATANWSN